MCGITLKAINGKESHQDEFKYHLIVNMFAEEIISTRKM